MHHAVEEAAAAGTPRRARSKRDRNNDSKARDQVQAVAMADVIRRVVDAAPPLTTEQIAKLAVLLQGPGTEGNAVKFGAPGGAARSPLPKRNAGASG